MKKIAVVDYGMGNIHSMCKALELYNVRVDFSADPALLSGADALVLPGDGHFAAAMQNLTPLRPLLDDHLAAGKALLGVCIGFQVLFGDSTEAGAGSDSEKVSGLGLIPGEIRRFTGDASLRVPHMGWNQLVNVKSEFSYLSGEHMYFIHSYHAQSVPGELVVAECDYGGETFPAAVKKENILATQFHPEKSAKMGLKFLENWIESI